MLAWTREPDPLVEVRQVVVTENQFGTPDVVLIVMRPGWEKPERFFGRGDTLGMAFARARWRWGEWSTWDDPGFIASLTHTGETP
jgi:hypothetical protein